MAGQLLTFPIAAQIKPPLAHFIRLGESGYRKLEHLQSAGRLPVSRVVADASRFRHQRELVQALRAAGAEVVLDTKAAELAAPWKASGRAKGAPWSELAYDGLVGPNVFSHSHHGDVFGAIARFAVQHRFDAVLAPGHFIDDQRFEAWFDIDCRSCEELRKALDREGGTEIAIDYLLIAKHTTLNDDDRRSAMTERLADLPFDNLWIRASGFGHDASPLALQRYIGAVSSLHNLGKPVIADYLGGLVGEAVMAFGAASGVSHGVGEAERFDAASWHKSPPPREDDSGGRTTRIPISHIGRSLTVPELELLAGAVGGRRHVVCNDVTCCPKGLADMIDDPRRHAATQAIRRVEALSSVPDLNREEHFINNNLRAADRAARQVRNLRPSAAKAEHLKVEVNGLMKRMSDFSEKISRTRSTLEHLHESRGNLGTRARPAPLRKNGSGSGGRFRGRSA